MELAIIKNTDDLARISKAFAESGFFSDAKDATKAMVKIMAGLEAGFGTFQSMQGVHIVQGKPVLASHLIAAAVRRHPDYDYKVTKHTDSECSITFMYHGETAGVSDFSMDNAKKAGLLNRDNWKKYPRNMLFARCMSNGQKWYAPDVFSMPVYTPDEFGFDENADGEMVEVERVEAEEVESVPVSTPPTLSQEKAQDLHKALGRFGIKDHKAFACEIMGRQLDSFTELTTRESLEVYEAAEARAVEQAELPEGTEPWRFWKSDRESVTWAKAMGRFPSDADVELELHDLREQITFEKPPGMLANELKRFIYKEWYSYAKNPNSYTIQYPNSQPPIGEDDTATIEDLAA